MSIYVRALTKVTNSFPFSSKLRQILVVFFLFIYLFEPNDHLANNMPVYKMDIVNLYVKLTIFRRAEKPNV